MAKFIKNGVVRDGGNPRKEQNLKNKGYEIFTPKKSKVNKSTKPTTTE